MALALTFVPACYTGVGFGPTVGYAVGRGPSLGWGATGSARVLAVELGQSFRKASGAPDRVVSYVATSPSVGIVDWKNLRQGADGLSVGANFGVGLPADGDAGLIDGVSFGYLRGLGGESCTLGTGTSTMGSIALGVRIFADTPEVYLAPKIHFIADCPFHHAAHGYGFQF